MLTGMQLAHEGYFHAHVEGNRKSAFLAALLTVRG